MAFRRPPPTGGAALGFSGGHPLREPGGEGDPGVHGVQAQGQRARGATGTALGSGSDASHTASLGLALLALSARRPVSPPRRLEATFRGTFRGLSSRTGPEDAQDSGPWDPEEDHPALGEHAGQESNAEVAASSAQILGRAPARPMTSCSARLPGKGEVGGAQVRAASSEGDTCRERMGFGKHELGAVPSGRSSVPAVRGGRHSAPLPPGGGASAVADEGIELESLAGLAERHIRRILERALNGGTCSSRGASCEPPPSGVTEVTTPGGRPNSRCQQGHAARPSFSPSPCPSPTYPCTALCPSPSPRAAAEEMRQPLVRVRLCASRCGSSSAVLELSLAHVPGCGGGASCCCSPSPAEAEAQLLAHFTCHSLLRLTATRPPVRVLLEKLPQQEEEDGGEAGLAACGHLSGAVDCSGVVTDRRTETALVAE